MKHQKQVTKLIIRQFNIKKVGVDFMGYVVNNTKSLTFHHAIVQAKQCKEEHMESNGYVESNGVVLTPTSHAYLHQIEKFDQDRDTYQRITEQMLEQKRKGHLDPENLLEINRILTDFEVRHAETRTTAKQKIIKKEYITERKYAYA